MAEYKDRGSTFLAYIFPCASTRVFKAKMQELKKEHPKAVHYCFAYKIGTDGNNFRSSDDGEPSGTAGKPILRQIESKKLTDTGIIVVRYFGGTLLGVPGLIQAYKTSSLLALQIVPIISKPILKFYQLQFGYPVLNEIMVIIKQLNAEIQTKETQLFCKLSVGVPLNKLEEFIMRIKNLANVEMTEILP
ncbi:MAG TPA: YigZ family protein [Ferruginibacter sp.]|nr:YigZ family protein [Ferruginibacter sp.]